ncbi:OLC1v1001351C1 [Oldenlandia corymbosa var. corymbosa]|uniref:OLC1v1001351C1 n=1 Tax=Oldenlandia corymbosa var. corymbosa TaxID=529605 RepID=A0AAV1D522_OLDCO|nr:OLC1v1001351C1 [Oldenlandia corymbosa var. corymbosa]
MPATAGRVRMPPNNRVHSSAALQTHGIWQSAIGYDPYAPKNKYGNRKSSSTVKPNSSAKPEADNAYASFQELMALAKITNLNSDKFRGACQKCGWVGHLQKECRNFLSCKYTAMKKDVDLMRQEEGVLEKLKVGEVKRGEDESSDDDEEEEDSVSLDSEYDSEIERIIAERAKKSSGNSKVRSSRRREDGEYEEKRGMSKKSSWKGGNSDSEDEARKEKRGRRDDKEESLEEDEQRRMKRKNRKERNSHKYSSSVDDSTDSLPGGRRYKRRSLKSASSSDFDA